jgi:hypothetical protein
MTKSEARAVFARQRRILAALEACLPKLSEHERVYAEAYWAASIRGYVQGTAYGGMPIWEAEKALSERT